MSAAETGDVTNDRSAENIGVRQEPGTRSDDKAVGRDFGTNPKQISWGATMF
jgi:hypothetical protein